jgi:D-serine deaminase-like pyridoxal phosphate-dependent protein
MNQIGFELAADLLRARPSRPVHLETAVPIEELPTPALLLDADALERNLQRMREFLKGRGKEFRPHAKTHKCPLIAARQLELGAAGVCAAKVSEAVVLVNAGVGKVLLTSAVMTPAKAEILASLSLEAERLDVVVDSDEGLALLARAISPESDLGVVIDVDVAMGRTGTRDADQMKRLADAASATPGLRFRGVQHYAGHLMHMAPYEKRRDRSLTLWQTVAGIVETLAASGFHSEVVTGGGTGTYDIDSEVACITDLQVGSYIFMDQEYRLIGGREGDRFDDFEVALQVAVTAISQPVPGVITVDGGYKAFASDSVSPVPLDLADTEYRFAGDEHGVLLLGSGSQEPLLGTVQRFITPHCDPTVNLYDYYWLCSNGLATDMWPITARGCSW